METGFKRNLLAELLDSVGRGVLLMALGIGWFVFLWGLNLPALLAGIALGTLLLLLRRLYRQTTLVRRETALRCRIGGELLLEKMLLSEAKEAHFQAALLLEEKWPLRMQRITADGALCRQEKPSGGAETLLVQCVRMPPEGELSIGQLVEAHRAMQRQQRLSADDADGRRHLLGACYYPRRMRNWWRWGSENGERRSAAACCLS